MNEKLRMFVFDNGGIVVLAESLDMARLKLENKLVEILPRPAVDALVESGKEYRDDVFISWRVQRHESFGEFDSRQRCLEWTDEPPTEPGWYLFTGDSENLFLIEVTPRWDGKLIGRSTREKSTQIYTPLSELRGGVYFGPIRHPINPPEVYSNTFTHTGAQHGKPNNHASI